MDYFFSSDWSPTYYKPNDRYSYHIDYDSATAPWDDQSPSSWLSDSYNHRDSSYHLVGSCSLVINLCWRYLFYCDLSGFRVIVNLRLLGWIIMELNIMISVPKNV